MTFLACIFSANARSESALLRCIEDLQVEQFIPRFAVEGLVVTILLKAAWFDVTCCNSHPAEPLSHRLGNKLWSVVRAEIVWRSSPHKQLRQPVQHRIGVKTPSQENGYLIGSDI